MYFYCLAHSLSLLSPFWVPHSYTDVLGFTLSPFSPDIIFLTLSWSLSWSLCHKRRDEEDWPLTGFSSKPSLPVGEGSEKERDEGLKQKDTVIIIWFLCVCLCVWWWLWLFQGLFREPGEVWEQRLRFPELSLHLQTSYTHLEEAQSELRHLESVRLHSGTPWVTPTHKSRLWTQFCVIIHRWT